MYHKKLRTQMSVPKRFHVTCAGRLMCDLTVYHLLMDHTFVCMKIHKYFLLHLAWVIDDAKCIESPASVCLSTAACLHYCTDPDVTWGSGRGCPLIVHYWADLQSVHGLRCYGNITWTLVMTLPPSCDMTTSINNQSLVYLNSWQPTTVECSTQYKM